MRRLVFDERRRHRPGFNYPTEIFKHRQVEARAIDYCLFGHAHSQQKLDIDGGKIGERLAHTVNRHVWVLELQLK